MQYTDGLKRVVNKAQDTNWILKKQGVPEYLGWQYTYRTNGNRPCEVIVFTKTGKEWYEFSELYRTEPMNTTQAVIWMDGYQRAHSIGADNA
jgi:hypothetical protein